MLFKCGSKELVFAFRFCFCLNNVWTIWSDKLYSRACSYSNFWFLKNRLLVYSMFGNEWSVEVLLVGSVFVKFDFETSGRCVLSISEKSIVGMFDVWERLTYSCVDVSGFWIWGWEYICKMLFWNAGMLCFRFVMIQWTLGCFLEQWDLKAVRTPSPSNSKSWRPLKHPNPSNNGA